MSAFEVELFIDPSLFHIYDPRVFSFNFVTGIEGEEDIEYSESWIRCDHLPCKGGDPKPAHHKKKPLPVPKLWCFF